jgi:dipeptidyl aminopeptidase/acylaminoacyl peptidase
VPQETPGPDLPPPVVTVIQQTPTVLPADSPATATARPAATENPTATPHPFSHLTINSLANRTFGGGEVTIQETMAVYDLFTRFLVSYPSDGLEIYGFLNVPHGDGSFPVVIAIHGYIDPTAYDTLDYTTRYADALARAGFVVLHPNLRGYLPSELGENLFRVGMAADVLNLAQIVRETAGNVGALEKVNPDQIGLWGHSMGGGITLRSITIDPNLKAAVLYGSMSGDEIQNFKKIYEWSEGARGIEELAIEPIYLDEISPINFLDRIQAAVSIHHGEADTLVPPEWSDELCLRLNEIQARVTCYTYPDQPHTFYGEGDQLLIDRMISFFREQLAN